MFPVDDSKDLLIIQKSIICFHGIGFLSLLPKMQPNKEQSRQNLKEEKKEALAYLKK